MHKPEHGSVKLQYEKVCLCLQEIGQTVRYSENRTCYTHCARCYYSLCFQMWLDSGCCNVGKVGPTAVVSRRYRLIFLELHWQSPCLPQTEYSTYSKQHWLYWRLASAAFKRHPWKKSLSMFQTIPCFSSFINVLQCINRNEEGHVSQESLSWYLKKYWFDKFWSTY